MSSSAAAGKSAALSDPAPAGTTAEELDGLGDHLDRLPLRPVLRFPFAPVEPAVDADGTTLAQVLRAALGLIAEDGHVEVVGLVDPLTRLVPSAAVDGEAQTADGRAAGRVA
jgi:hypothetical protein